MKNKSMRNCAGATCIIGGVSSDEEIKYKNILKENGIDKGIKERLTIEDLRQVFIYMQEDAFIGS